MSPFTIFLIVFGVVFLFALFIAVYIFSVTISDRRKKEAAPHKHLCYPPSHSEKYSRDNASWQCRVCYQRWRAALNCRICEKYGRDKPHGGQCRVGSGWVKTTLWKDLKAGREFL